MTSPCVRDLLSQIQVEYLERPGLQLTASEAMRHWDMTRALFEGVFGALVDAGFLVRSSDGLFRYSGARPRAYLARPA
jgi:hypothetical protein